MSTTARDIAAAAIEAAMEEMRKLGMEAQIKQLPRLLLDVLREKGELVSATLITPSGDAGKTRNVVQAVLEKKFGTAVQLLEKADPSLVGGAVLQIGDMRIDMSVKGALRELSETLKTPAASAK